MLTVLNNLSHEWVLKLQCLYLFNVFDDFMTDLIERPHCEFYYLKHENNWYKKIESNMFIKIFTVFCTLAKKFIQ